MDADETVRNRPSGATSNPRSLDANVAIVTAAPVLKDVVAVTGTIVRVDRNATPADSRARKYNSRPSFDHLGVEPPDVDTCHRA